MSVWHDIMDTQAEAENMRVRAALMRAVRERIDTLGRQQTTIAANPGITQPNVSDLMNGRISKFSLDALITIADRVGVHLAIAHDPDPTPADPLIG